MAPSFFPHHDVHVGKSCGGRTVAIDEALIATYAAGTGGPPARPVVDGRATAPALLFHSEVYRTLDWYLPAIFGNLHARQEWEFFAPLEVGTTVRTHSTVVARYAKRDREYVVNEVVITDTDGRWLQRSRTHQSFLADDARREVVVDRDRERRPERRRTVGEGPGTEVPTLARTITLDMCAAFSGPDKNYHTDQDMARALGFPDVVVQGMLPVSLVVEHLTATFGEGWLRAGKLDVKLVNVVWPGDTLTMHGKLRDEISEGARKRIGLDVWGTKDDGTPTLVGTASALA